MGRYDGLIIPRSYSEYINKTDAATLQQALQLSGVLSGAVAAGDNKAVKSSAVNNALTKYGQLETITNPTKESLNDYIVNGHYAIGIVGGHTNLPTQKAGTLLVFNAEYFIVQFYIVDGKEQYTRTSVNVGSTWTDWEQLATKSGLSVNTTELLFSVSGQYTATEDCYVQCLIVSNQPVPFLVNGVPYGAADSIAISGGIYITMASGFFPSETSFDCVGAYKVYKLR